MNVKVKVKIENIKKYSDNYLFALSLSEWSKEKNQIWIDTSNLIVNYWDDAWQDWSASIILEEEQVIIGKDENDLSAQGFALFIPNEDQSSEYSLIGEIVVNAKIIRRLVFMDYREDIIDAWEKCEREKQYDWDYEINLFRGTKPPVIVYIQAPLLKVEARHPRMWISYIEGGIIISIPIFKNENRISYDRLIEEINQAIDSFFDEEEK